MKSYLPFWVPFDGENIPKNAVVGGHYHGQRIFVGRAPHERSLTPGMVLENEKALGCVSHRKEIGFEILVYEQEVAWVVAEDGHVPLNAFPGGYREHSNETLYIGRYKHENSLVVGKIHPSHSVAYIAYDEKELNNRTYEVLVI